MHHSCPQGPPAAEGTWTERRPYPSRHEATFFPWACLHTATSLPLLAPILSAPAFPPAPSPKRHLLPLLAPWRCSKQYSQAYPKALIEPELYPTALPLPPVQGGPRLDVPHPWGQRPPHPGPTLPPYHRLRLKVLSFRCILNFNPEKLPQGHYYDYLCFIAEKGWKGLVSWPRPLRLSDSSLIPEPQSPSITQEG